MTFDIVQQLNSRQQEMLTIFGFYVEFVEQPNSDNPMQVDYHTHGLDHLGHRDFQIVCDVGPDKALVIVDKLVKRIRQGLTVAPGDTILRFFNHAPAHFVEGIDNEGRDVIRVIIPDQYGNYLASNIEDNYRYQFIKDLKVNHEEVS